MKNVIKSFAALAASLLAFNACQQELAPEQPAQEELFYVTFVAEEPATKTTVVQGVDGEGNKVANYSWTASDANSERWTVYRGTDAATSVTPSLSDDVMTLTVGFSSPSVAGDKFVAVFNEGVEASQTITSESVYATTSDVMMSAPVAYEAGQNSYAFRFKRIGAIGKATVKGLTGMEILQDVTIESTDGAVLAASYDHTNSAFSATGSTSIKLDLNEVSVEPDANGYFSFYFITVPIEAPGSILKMTVTALDDQAEPHYFTKTLGKAITFDEGDVHSFNVSGFQEITKGDMWTYSFSSKVISQKGEQTINGQAWDIAGERSKGSSDYFGSDNTYGQQLGSGTSPFSYLTLTSNFGELYGINTVEVDATGSKDIAGKISVSVGGVALLCNEKEDAALVPKTVTTFTFVSDKLLTGDVSIKFTQTSEKAFYVKRIAINPVPSCGAPTADRESGELLGGTRVLLSTETAGASIYYTLDGSDPTTASILYADGVITPTDNDCTIKAIASKQGFANSEIVTYTFTRPVCQTPVIVFDKGVATITTETDDAAIYYNIGDDDVADPTTSSLEYNNSNKPSVESGQTIKAIAAMTGAVSSQVASEKYSGKDGVSDIINRAVTTAACLDLATSANNVWKVFDVTGTSGAEYTFRGLGMNTAADNIAVLWNKNGWMYCKTSGGTVQSITVTGADKVINVYGSHEAFSAEPTGTATGTLTASASGAKFEFAEGANYEYFALHGTDSSTGIISIVVEWGAPAEVTSIKIETEPIKTLYHEGETFDATGMVVKAIYDDKTEKDVTSECTVDPSGSLTAGLESVTVKYKTFETVQAITVRQAWALQSISVKTNPTKMTYHVDDQFDPTGMVLTGVYSDGVDNENRDITSGYSCSKTFTEESDNASVNITYDGKGCTLNGIQVLPKLVLKDFTVTPSTVGPVAATAYDATPITITADEDVAWTVSLVEGSSSDITFAENGSGSQSYNVQLTANGGDARSFKLRFSTSAYVTTSSYDVTIRQAAGKEPVSVTKTETFEDQGSDTTYNGQKTYEASDSNAGISWFVEHGTVSTTAFLTGAQSMHMRAYYAKNSNSTTWNGNLPYLESKTPLKGLKSVSFNAAIGTNNTLKYDTYYSTNGKDWIQVDSNQSLSTTSEKKSFDIPNSDKATEYYFKIAVSSASTHANKPSKAGNITFRVDDIEVIYYE